VVLVAYSSAAADGIRVGTFDPVPSTAEHGFQLESADAGRAGTLTTTTVLSLATNSAALDPSDDLHLFSHREMLEFGAAYALLDCIDIGVRMPLYLQRSDNALSDANGMALGDLTLNSKGVVRRGPLAAGLALHITLPAATEEKFAGMNIPSVRTLALLTVRPTARLMLSLNAGPALRKTATYYKSVPSYGSIQFGQGSGLSWGAGASLRVTDRILATGEVFGERDFASERRANPISSTEGLIGASYRFGQRLTIGAAVGRSISSGLDAFALRGTLTASFISGPVTPPARSRRQAIAAGGKGTAASEERCPQQAEDWNGVRNDGGCLDTDHDGLLDVRDKCPQQAEDRDGYQDGDGCPELDNDGDGLIDVLDRCPLQPETINGVKDDDGCPDQGSEAAAHVEVALAQSLAKAADATFQLGRKLMKEQQYLAACNAFEQSQRLDPLAGTQYNLANCYVEIGKLATAQTMYRELLRTDKNVQRRADVAERMTQMAPRVPRLKLSLIGRPTDVNVLMNGQDVNALVGIEVPLDFGIYTIVAGAPGYADWRKSVEVKQGGELVIVEIDLGTPINP